LFFFLDACLTYNGYVIMVIVVMGNAPGTCC